MVKRIRCKIIKSTSLNRTASNIYPNRQQSVMLPRNNSTSVIDNGHKNRHSFTRGQYRQSLAGYSGPEDYAGLFLDCFF